MTSKSKPQSSRETELGPVAASPWVWPAGPMSRSRRSRRGKRRRRSGRSEETVVVPAGLSGVKEFLQPAGCGAATSVRSAQWTAARPTTSACTTVRRGWAITEK